MRHALTLALIALCCGCPGGSSPATPPPDAAPAARTIEPLTDEGRARLQALGEASATAITAGDMPTAAAAWDLEQLWERVVEGLSLSDQVSRDARSGYLSSMRSSGGFPLAEMAGAQLDLRAVREDPEQGALLLFRAFMPDDSLVYVECLVDDGNAEDPKLIDVYAYANGEFLSRTVRRLIAPGLAEASKTPLSRLISGSSDAGEHLEVMQQAMALLQSGDAQGALRALDGLPTEVRQQKSVLIMRLRAAAALYDPLSEPPAHEEEYKQVLAEFKRVLSDDPRAQLVLIDYYLLEEDWEGFHRALETLAQAVGDDPYLDYLHAVGYGKAGDHDEALDAAFAALEREPLESIRLGIIDLYIHAERYELAASYLAALEDDFGYAFDFSQLPMMQPFLESEPGQAWLARERGE